MKVIKNRIASRLPLAALSLLALLAFITSCAKKEAEEIKIGAIIPLTGDQATYGEALKKGMDLAIENVNADGGIQGRRLHILFEDDQGDPKTGISAFRKLVTADRVPLVIGAMFSAVTLSIAPIAEKEQVVLLSPTSSAIDLTHAGDYIFRIYPSDTYDGIFLAHFSYEKLGARKVSVIYLQVASITAISNVFKEEFEKLGGKVLSMQGYKEGETEFRAQLLKANSESPDLMLIPGYLQEMGILLKQAKETGVNTQFMSISTFYDPQIIQLAGNAADGVIFSSPMFDLDSPSGEIKDFVSKYEAKYGAQPDILGGYGYDVVNIVSAALQNSMITPETIRDVLYSIKDFPGVTGTTSFDENGDVVKELRILKVVNGEFTYLDQ